MKDESLYSDKPIQPGDVVELLIAAASALRALPTAGVPEALAYAPEKLACLIDAFLVWNVLDHPPYNRELGNLWDEMADEWGKLRAGPLENLTRRASQRLLAMDAAREN
jgi:hypothetical protein